MYLLFFILFSDDQVEGSGGEEDVDNEDTAISDAVNKVVELVDEVVNNLNDNIKDLEVNQEENEIKDDKNEKKKLKINKKKCGKCTRKSFRARNRSLCDLCETKEEEASTTAITTPSTTPPTTTTTTTEAVTETTPSPKTLHRMINAKRYKKQIFSKSCVVIHGGSIYKEAQNNKHSGP